MDERSAHVEVAFAAAVQCEHDAAIDDERQQRYPEHQFVIDGLRMEQTCDGFKEYVKRDYDQRHRVDKGSDHTGALVAKRLNLIGGAGLEIESDSG